MPMTTNQFEFLIVTENAHWEKMDQEGRDSKKKKKSCFRFLKKKGFLNPFQLKEPHKEAHDFCWRCKRPPTISWRSSPVPTDVFIPGRLALRNHKSSHCYFLCSGCHSKWLVKAKLQKDVGQTSRVEGKNIDLKIQH
ncbi:hypothetical protein CEXT_561961 [Caerostris extrusa]|uniref:Uncharacterized protein n=1 Tax=Caerostris extrusa TaxID=172846 RepID=A0AAV4NLG6_CAEEX|nr:hypothetical protein CEXT_561961 [Caerostris extrusa]